MLSNKHNPPKIDSAYINSRINILGLHECYEAQNFGAEGGIVIVEKDTMPSDQQRDMLIRLILPELASFTQEKNDGLDTARHAILFMPPKVIELTPQQIENINEAKKCLGINGPEDKTWEQLSSPLREHILESIAANSPKELENLTNNLPEDDIPELKDTFSFQVARIPIKIKIEKRLEDTTAGLQCHDLEQLFKFRKAGRLINPSTNTTITLEDIIPATEELKKITKLAKEDKTNQMERDLSFPVNADFSDKTFPAIFTFNSEAEAKALIQKIDPEQKLLGLEIKDNRLFIDQKNCKEGLVGKLLDQFEFPPENKNAQKVKNYLSTRSQNLDDHKIDSRWIKLGRTSESSSRNSKCNEAFKQLQKCMLPAENKLDLTKSQKVQKFLGLRR